MGKHLLYITGVNSGMCERDTIRCTGNKE